MKKITIPIAVAAMAAVFAAGGNAQCLASANPRTMVTLPDGINGSSPSAADRQRAEVAKPKAENDAFSIVGVWNVNFVSGGVSVDQGFDLWSSDGTEVLNDTPPPATGNVCVGVWIKTAETTFKLKHVSWTFDAGGNLNGTAIIRETVTLGSGADSYQGPFTVDVFDLSGKNLMHFDGTVTGFRVKVD